MSKPDLVCAKCGKRDKSTKGHVGTKVTMRCIDCGEPITGKALLCRDCCPTGHGTRYDSQNT